jgi:hypothetical protein
VTPLYVVLVLGLFAFRIWLLVSRLSGPPTVDGLKNVQAPAPDDPRWLGSRGDQLTGRDCQDCGQKIMMESQGKSCTTCGQALHKKACAKRHRLTAHGPAPVAPYR